MNHDAPKVVIIGAGPSGLACAYHLGKHGISSLVVEKDETAGGLCRTFDYSGYLFDIGGHRFLTKSELVNSLWHDILGEELLSVKRVSRIYFNNKYLKYPLSLFDTFINLGIVESTRCMASYITAQLDPSGDDATFEGWMTNRFGKRLYEIFFDTYTKKVWELPPKDISSDWAAQRIKGLSLREALKSAIMSPNNNGLKTLSQEFLYPRKGPGQFYDRLCKKSSALGAHFFFNCNVTGIECDGKKVTAITIQDTQKQTEKLPVDVLFSSMPLPHLINSINSDPPKEIHQSASQLKFRSFLVVNVILEKEHLFPDQWVYVHSPEVKLGRIQNYKNWSMDMISDPKNTSLGLEYFCREGDDLWNMNDKEIINFAMNELQEIGIASQKHLVGGFVLRRKNVYPVYSLDYQEKRAILKTYLKHFQNLRPIGRAGLFKYDNSDLALLSGIVAAENYLGKSNRDIWNLGEDQKYLER
jgi:protoporphyrinogen oxidase